MAGRPLAPKLGDEQRTISRVPEDTKTKRASAACKECQHRRTKCTPDEKGGPCAECRIHDRACIIDEASDRRRKVNAKRTEEERDYYMAYVRYIIEGIRHGENHEIMQLIASIKSGCGDDMIHYTLSQFGCLSPHFYLKAPSASPPSRVRDDISRERGRGQ
ncbi:hypothetical protein BJX61DRAFT_445469 [Aspergillus egyptiacus]|nr:hypothetical protein BJX61DRAFT_445469 [Aspergillus egyptiacus]